MPYQSELGMYFKFIFLVFSTLFLLACSKNEQKHEIPIIAHAASGLFNPQRFYKDNTLEAIEYALNFKELDGIEVDVQVSADGTLWLYHDEFLESQTNAEGEICLLKDNYLENVYYRSLNNEKLARLIDVNFSKISGEKIIFLDFKFNYGCDFSKIHLGKLIKQIDIIKNNKLTIIPVLSAPEQIEYFKQKGFESIYLDVPNITKAKDISTQYLVEGVFIRNANVTKSDVQYLQSTSQLKVVIFDVRSSLSIRNALIKSPDFLMVEEFKTALLEGK